MSDHPLAAFDFRSNYAESHWGVLLVRLGSLACQLVCFFVAERSAVLKDPTECYIMFDVLKHVFDYSDPPMSVFVVIGAKRLDH